MTPAAASLHIVERITALDLIRGVAILGVGLANVVWFAYSDLAPLPALAWSTGGDRVVAALLVTFVDGKFVTTLSFLFGIGLFILASRRSEGDFVAYYLKRMAVLFAIGFLHVLFLWWGDILTLYAIVGIVAVFFRNTTTKVLVILGGLGWLISLVMVALLALAMVLVPEKMAAEFGPDPAVWSEGGFFQLMLARLFLWVIAGCSAIFFVGPIVGGLFLLGIAAGRELMARGIEGTRRIFRATFFVCAPIGLAISGLAGWRYLTAEESYDWIFLQTLGEPFMALMYVSLLGMWSLSGFLAPIRRALEAVGRLALTSYLFQSLIFAGVFTSMGFAMVDQTDRVGALALVAGVWAFNVGFSVLWLRFFEIGPVEWAWRSVVDGRARSLRRRRPQAEFEL